MNFIQNETAEKLRGGYYTPIDLASYAAQWVGEINPTSILEPSCGDGSFLQAVANASLTKAKITAIELNELEASKAKARANSLPISADIISTDFLAWALHEMRPGGRRYDAILGNPPFIRYQYLPADFQKEAEKVFFELRCKFTKHTNAWVPFILASIALLRAGGRLAMVVPSEIIHVLHAQSLRTFLANECSKVVLIDPEEIWFENTLQGAVLLMAQKKDNPGQVSEGLGLVPVRGKSFLTVSPSETFQKVTPISGKAIEAKWTWAFLSQSVRDLIEEIEGEHIFTRFSKVADVDVGIVTGANKFFLVNDETVAKNRLEQWAHPMFGRSEHAPGVIYDEAQHERNKLAGLPANFIWFPNQNAAKNSNAAAYISVGEEQELHKRFKCRVRKPWYTVPSVSTSSIGMLKRCHDAPKLVLNKAGAFTTDTAYRIETHKLRPSTFVSNFINPLTALSAELEGRTYGGGVLELVPSEIERLLVPTLNKAATAINDIDRAVRNKRMPQVQETCGMEVLKSGGLSASNSSIIFSAWAQLRNRRQRMSETDDPAVD
ncbi:N-6 DNA methylase [Xanthomonas axonopodis]|uniref:site-specific DNA-methyltransferase (adenine-specific) n=1 Tax=Xanthomonas axonopodis pv. cajani TaxID=487827 RepID=A0ABX3MH60_9XANT|nr:N-6 DNA methylase [Xanthomonas axonopodis]OOX22483.1 modification methylase [Xanthomonas axonopodis pv. cajani]